MPPLIWRSLLLTHFSRTWERFQDTHMLQDAVTIRYYQKLTDALVEQWNRGYRYDELRLFLDGYLAALRQSNAMEPYLIHRLEEEVSRYLYDPSNFETPQPQAEVDYR